MGKGDKQHGNREAKKPKANKKAAPLSATSMKVVVPSGKAGKVDAKK